MGWAVVGTAVFGAPRFCICLWENAVFFRVLAQNRGAPKTAVPTTTHPIPHLGGAIQTLAWVLSWARPGPIPGPRWSRPDSPCALFYGVSDPSRSRGGGHPGPSWSHPAPERSFQGRAWTGRNIPLGHFRFGCPRENFTKTSRHKRCEKRKISHKFHSAGAWH